MTGYVTREHVDPGDLGESSDQNQGMDNEEALKAAVEVKQVTVIFDGGGSPLAAGARMGFPWKFATFTITEWEVAEIEGTSGSCVFDVWRLNAAIPTVTNTIVGGGNKPTLSAATRAVAAPASWTSVTLVTNDEIVLNVDSAATVEKVAVTLKGTMAV